MDTVEQLAGVMLWPMLGGVAASLLFGGGFWLTNLAIRFVWDDSNRLAADELIGTTLKVFFTMGILLVTARLAYDRAGRITCVVLGIAALGLFMELSANLAWRGWLTFGLPAVTYVGQTLQRRAHSMHR
jgi:hypothetical protein